ncbi:glycosyltransferase family 2 protein [Opitutus terrae]|uniref:Glycosyl transferase family 2 n=1 Tax=Opitutus terrae (strain DSM 11246 / JCM 15787 / PB90-1) TaxID=452637 RepID=B1ZSZ7_OPITP|nr:glycosyltransferase family A protein [Opitutus terrae]ACB75786.1 glycosyl transferase family 2 [Opitutus terrae PB90-1]
MSTLVSQPRADGAERPNDQRRTDKPALSVIMPAYNAGRFLAPAIESVLSQTWRDFEFIIIDDGSTDGTREAIERYAESDPRIVSRPNPRNLGVTPTLNRAIALARAEWIARMDADDLSLPHRFERQMALVRAHPEVGLVTCPFNIIDAEDRQLPGWRGICFQQELLPFFLLFYNRLNAHGQVLYSARLVRELGGYRERYLRSEATELWIRMVRAGSWAVIPEPLYAWRAANPNSVTKQNPFRYGEFSLIACQEEIARACGLNVSREEMIALRDFWVRFDSTATDWDHVERLLEQVTQRYSPPRPVRHWRRKVAVAQAGGWFSLAALKLKQRRFGAAAAHLRRATRVAGWALPHAAVQFLREYVAVGGHLARRA